MGLTFRQLEADIDEGMDRALPPEDLVQVIAREKAAWAAAHTGEQTLVIAADTVVALDGRVLGKPRDEAQAAAMLRALSGRRHHVYTGYAVRQGGRTAAGCGRAEVTFRRLTAEEIGAYIETGEPMDKAGAYGIQGLGALLVEELRGDYFSVVGLPVCALGQTLAQFGVDCLDKARTHRLGR